MTWVSWPSRTKKVVVARCGKTCLASYVNWLMNAAVDDKESGILQALAGAYDACLWLCVMWVRWVGYSTRFLGHGVQHLPCD